MLSILCDFVSTVTFEDKKRENFERGNLELEKRRQALQEQQRKEQERLAAIEREEQERKVSLLVVFYIFHVQRSETLSIFMYECNFLSCIYTRKGTNRCDTTIQICVWVLFACFRSVNAWSKRGDDSRNKKNSWRNKEN